MLLSRVEDLTLGPSPKCTQKIFDVCALKQATTNPWNPTDSRLILKARCGSQGEHMLITKDPYQERKEV